MGPDNKTAFVAERTTGAVKEVSVSAEPTVKTLIPVDPSKGQMSPFGCWPKACSPAIQATRL
jgi:hypothetical protein